MTNAKIRVCIVSSLDALGLAKSLQDNFNTDFSEACIWSDGSGRQVSRTLNEMLTEVREYDFALVVLTKNALLNKEIGDDDEQRVRDDCLYKSGLFMGALGRDRCFLISSVRKSDLPVDLQGSNYLYFNEPDDLADDNQCQMALGEGSAKLKEVVQQEGRRIRQEKPALLTFGEILKKERLVKGELIKPDQDKTIVMVTDLLPIESFPWAVQIKENLDNGIHYFYFFSAEAGGAERICRLLQMILLAESLRNDPTKGESFKDCCEQIKASPDSVRKNLETIYRNNSLNIYFSPVEPAFNFRIHNASNSQFARIYLRYGNRFVDWSASGSATAAFNWLQRFEDPKEKNVIFCSNEVYNLADPRYERFREDLNREITFHFPDIDEDVKQLCGLKRSEKQNDHGGGEASGLVPSQILTEQR